MLSNERISSSRQGFIDWVQNYVRIVTAPELLQPFINATQHGTIDRWVADEEPWWAIRVLNMLEQHGGAERQKFVGAVGQFSTDEQVIIVCKLVDSGWEHSGRRITLPTFISELTMIDAQRSTHDGDQFLKTIKRQFMLRCASNPIAEEIMDRLQDAVVGYRQDLVDLGVRPI